MNGLSKELMPKRATIYTIAEMANVSISTVSRIINKNFTGDDRIRKAVLSAIKKVNYFPRAEARRLTGKRLESKIIGVLAPFFIHPFFVEVLKGVYKNTHEHKHSLILYDVQTKQLKKAIFEKVLEEGLVDGILLVNMHLNEQEYKALYERTPVVLIAAEAKFADYVIIDQYEGIANGLRYVSSLGHRSVAFINNEKEIHESVVRESAFRNTAEEIGIRYIVDHRAVDRRAGYFAAKNILENYPECRCLFYYSDLQAYGGVDYINEQRLSETVSIIGFDGFETSLHMNLTTVVQPMETMGAMGAQLLFKKLKDPKSQKEQIILETSLVKGKTCKAVAHE
jgi:DNA-binding LacI/PurR family transcriptional regulator